MLRLHLATSPITCLFLTASPGTPPQAHRDTHCWSYEGGAGEVKEARKANKKFKCPECTYSHSSNWNLSRHHAKVAFSYIPHHLLAFF
jgi:hypothetical protein